MSTGTRTTTLDQIAQLGDRGAPVEKEAVRLEPILDARFALTWRHTVVVAWFALSFILLNHLPLSLHTTWQHASQGRWILDHGHLPDSMPYAELAEGMPYVNGHWLSDVVIAFAASLGSEWVSSLGAIATTLALLLWCRVFFRLSGRLRFSLALTAALTVYWSFGFGAVRSQMLAAILLPTILLIMWAEANPGESTARTSRVSLWRVITSFTLFTLWANLDTSHLVGVLLVASFTLGIAIDQWIDGVRVKELLANCRLQRWILFSELAILATLLTPNGFTFWSSLFGLDRLGPIWSRAGAGYGMSLASTSGALFGVMFFALILLWIRRQYPITAFEVIITFACVVLCAFHIGFIFWCAPVILMLIGRHLRGAATRRSDELPLIQLRANDEKSRERRPLQFAWSLISLLLLWFGFAFSPSANPILSDKTRPAQKLFDENVPLHVSRFLSDSKISGTTWAPADWSDWMTWQAADNSNSTPGRGMFVNSQLDRFPALVQRDYWHIFRGDKDWELRADRYRIETIVIDRKRQPRLAAEIMRTEAAWRLVFESPEAMVAIKPRQRSRANGDLQNSVSVHDAPHRTRSKEGAS